jgi:hypothetical protein
MPPFGKLNYIDLGSDGTLKPNGQNVTTVPEIDAIFEYLEETNQSKLTLHFHGGLVSEVSGLATAKEMSAVYANAGAHPVAFIWKTGLLTTIKDNLTTINETKLFKKLGALAIKHAMKALGLSIPGRGAGQALSLSEIQSRMASGMQFEEFDATARGAAQVTKESELQVMEPDIRASIEEDVEADGSIEHLLQTEAPTIALFNLPAVQPSVSDRQRGIVAVAKLSIGIAQIVLRVVRRYINNRDHGFYPTVVEELLRQFYMADLGQWVWGNMTRKAATLWNSNSGLQSEAIHGCRYFLERLCKLQAKRSEFIVDLVGHSAGSIVICQMLKTARSEGLSLRVRRIIFMAPACTSELFHDEIVQQSCQYEQFRMFTMSDDYECKNQLVPLVYPRSLLYLVSGILDDHPDEPVAGMTRFMQNPPFSGSKLLSIASFLRTPGSDRLVLSKTADNAPRGLRCTAERHQDFDENGPMQDSLIYLISY